MNNFVPLRIITGYSFLESGLTIENAIIKIHKNGYPGAGISDKSNLFGVPEFIKGMNKINLPFIIGVNFKILDDEFVFYIKNEEGYKNLINLTYISQIRSISLDDLKENSNGIIAVLETNYGKFKSLFDTLNEVTTGFTKYLNEISSIYKDDFYLGIEVTSKQGVRYANKIRQFANKYPYSLVAFPRIKYPNKEDAISISIVNAISNDEKIDIKKLDGPEYFMSYEDYKKIYTTKEIENTKKILESSTFSFQEKRGKLLTFPCLNSKIELKNKTFDKLKALNLDKDSKYVERLNKELDVISTMGYDDYFLIVEDYVNWAKNNDILVGPGRGSAAGSLVCYLLNITQVDPLKYDLQFERFLNPYRKTMPDIDVDFEDSKRGLILEYITKKYGSERVASIITFQTIQAKQSIRDICRIYSVQEHFVSLLSKSLGKGDLSLSESYKRIPEFKEIVDSDEYFKDIVRLAHKIEKLPRQHSVHPSGVILSDKKIIESMPVLFDLDGNLLTQYEGPYLEEQGFLKMDLLSLRNLTTISYAVNLINCNKNENLLNSNFIPYDDQNAIDVIASGKTMGIFQLESAGMRRAIKILKPKCFNDIVQLISIFRPGPMDNIKDFALRKHGKKKITYISKEVESVLADTYGVLVYQEQVNSLAVKMAGFTLGEADMFRRAVSKKDKSKMASLKQNFIDGSIKNGYSEKDSVQMFENIERFADYGFNKSHAVVYAIVACRTAYLKAHHPLEFYKAILQTASGTNDVKFSDYLNEMANYGIKVLVPDINKSDVIFNIDNGNLLYPLDEIKNINYTLAETIVKERNENGFFKDIFDFALRMFSKKITLTQLKSLISAGAFDSINHSRATLHANAMAALQYAELNTNLNGQLTLGIQAVEPPLLNVIEDDPMENLINESDAIGRMLSNNPLIYKQDAIKVLNATTIEESRYQDKPRFACIIRSIKTIKTKKGQTMAFVKVFDANSELEIIVFSDLYSKSYTLLNKKNYLIFEGKFDEKSEEDTFIASNIELLKETDNE